jgi:hypothetical protein
LVCPFEPFFVGLFQRVVEGGMLREGLEGGREGGREGGKVGECSF